MPLTRKSSGARPAAGWTNARLCWLSMMLWTTVRSDGRGCEFAALMVFGAASGGLRASVDGDSSTYPEPAELVSRVFFYADPDPAVSRKVAFEAIAQLLDSRPV